MRAPEGGSLSDEGVALSPGGRSIVFTARGKEGRPALWVRSFDSLLARRLEGTEGARFPFWSPDGRRLGFFSDTDLVTIELIGGSRRAVARTAGVALARGASWGANDEIVYGPSFSSGLMRVSATGGGGPELATRLDPAAGDGTHRFPVFLPDGRHFLFYAAGGAGAEPGDICIGQIGSLEFRRLTRAHSAAAFMAPHFLAFARGEALVAQEIDLEGFELRADAVPLGASFPSNTRVSGYRPLSSIAGVAAYRVPTASVTRVVWVHRAGREAGTVAEPVAWHLSPRLSPDGKRMSLSSNDGGDSEGDIWVLDPERGNRTRLTFAARDDINAAWSPDGQQLAICAIAPSVGLYLAESGGSGGERLWWEPHAVMTAATWPAHGDGVLVEVLGEGGQLDLWRVPPAGEGEPTAFLATPFGEHSAEVSPDGRWVAYTSDSSGRDEVYVKPTEGEGEVWTVSTGGGDHAAWRRDGRELFFVDAAGRIVAVPTTVTPSFSKGSPVVLFDARLEEAGGIRQYDVAPDGQRFLLSQRVPVGDPIVVVLGWAAEIGSPR